AVIVYYLLLLLMPFWQYPRLPRIGETLTVIKLVGLLVVILALVKWLFGERQTHLFRFTEIRLFFVLLVIAGASAVAITPGGLLSPSMQTFFSLAAYLFATLVFVDTPRRLETSCYVIVSSMVLASYSVYSGFVRYGARPGGIVGDSNYFALIAVATLPLTYFLLPAAAPAKRLLLAGSGIFIVGAVLLSGSRGGLVSLGFCVLYSLLRTRKRLLFSFTAAAVLAGLLAFLPQTGLDRILAQDTGTVAATQARIESSKAGWEMLKSSPLTGVGLGMFKPTFAWMNDEMGWATIAHNSYIEVAAELGVPALILFLLILWSSWRRARRTSRFLELAGDLAGGKVAVAIEIGIAGYAVGALFLSAEYSRQLWVLVALGAALGRLAMEHEWPQDAAAAVSDDESVDAGTVTT
ncbi:MAG TPA: O-antigen ligase family protein, partial [Bryobacteraceae bacterium]|nr:O-antigen ligase family protein [Bryobacteraceae bacterium]